MLKNKLGKEITKIYRKKELHDRIMPTNLQLKIDSPFLTRDEILHGVRCNDDFIAQTEAKEARKAPVFNEADFVAKVRAHVRQMAAVRAMKEKALKQQAKIKMEAEILIKRGGVRDFRGDFLDPQVAHLDE